MSEIKTQIAIFLTISILIVLGFTLASHEEKHGIEVKNTVIEDLSLTEPADEAICNLKDVICEYESKTIKATVTGYNSVSYQTDDSPCVGAGGYICGENDVVACPRKILLGTTVQIDGKQFRCLDRLARKYDKTTNPKLEQDYFDIFFDKDIQAAKAWGVQELGVTILN